MLQEEFYIWKPGSVIAQDLLRGSLADCLINLNTTMPLYRSLF